MHSSQRWLSAALQPTGREREKKISPPRRIASLAVLQTPLPTQGSLSSPLGPPSGVLSPQQQKHSLPMLESRSKLVNEMRTETNPGRDRSADPGVAN